MSIKICRVSPCTNRIGTNTQMVVSVDAVIAPATSLTPCTAASLTGTPSLRRR